MPEEFKHRMTFKTHVERFLSFRFGYTRCTVATKFIASHEEILTHYNYKRRLTQTPQWFMKLYEDTLGEPFISNEIPQKRGQK